MEIPGFNRFEFKAKTYTHTVYQKGDGRTPGVLIIQELPGIMPETIEFAERLHRDGYTVFMPHLFGAIGRKGGEPLKNLAKVCISLEFRLMTNRQSSPITDWLRALCRHMQQECGGPVAVVGMCYTGSFALALMVDEAVAAPVVCQPGTLDGLLTHRQRNRVGLTDAEMQAAKARVQKDNVPVMGFRFTHDVFCPRGRFDYLSDQLGDHFRRFEIDSSWFNPHRIPVTAHAVFTVDYVDKPDHPTYRAYQSLLAFFAERLQPAPLKLN